MSAERGSAKDTQQLRMLQSIEELRQQIAAGNISSLVVITVDEQKNGNCNVLVQDPLVLIGMMEELKFQMLLGMGG